MVFGITVLFVLLAACESNTGSEGPEWVEPGTSVSAIGSLVFGEAASGSSGADSCDTEAQCVELPRDVCWLEAFGATVALLEVEGPGRVVQSTKDCAADYYRPGRLVPVHVLAVVGGERLPYRAEVFMSDGQMRRRVYPGAVLVVGLRQSGDWFMLSALPVEVYGDVVQNISSQADQLPSTFDGLVAEYERVTRPGDTSCERYAATKMDDGAFADYVHTPWGCEVELPGSNTGEVEPRDPRNGVTGGSDDISSDSNP